MADIGNVVLKDHSNTNVTYVPVSEAGSVFALENNLDGRPAFAKRLTLQTRRVPTTGSHLVTGKLTIPVIEADANGNNQVVATDIVDIKFRLSSRSTANQRKETRNSIAALIADATIVAAAIDNAEGIF